MDEFPRKQHTLWQLLCLTRMNTGKEQPIVKYNIKIVQCKYLSIFPLAPLKHNLCDDSF